MFLEEGLRKVRQKFTLKILSVIQKQICYSSFIYVKYKEESVLQSSGDSSPL